MSYNNDDRNLAVLVVITVASLIFGYLQVSGYQI